MKAEASLQVSLSFLGAAQGTLALAKCLGAIDWHWVVVLTPTWALAAWLLLLSISVAVQEWWS